MGFVSIDDGVFKDDLTRVHILDNGHLRTRNSLWAAEERLRLLTLSLPIRSIDEG
jgi:hypothetical protein